MTSKCISSTLVKTITFWSVGDSLRTLKHIIKLNSGIFSKTYLSYYTSFFSNLYSYKLPWVLHCTTTSRHNGWWPFTCTKSHRAASSIFGHARTMCSESVCLLPKDTSLKATSSCCQRNNWKLKKISGCWQFCSELEYMPRHGKRLQPLATRWVMENSKVPWVPGPRDIEDRFFLCCCQCSHFNLL